MGFFVHDSAFVESEVVIGEGTKIWHHCQVRTGAKLGKNCILGKGVFIDTKVLIGNNVKIQNYVSVYHGVTVDDDVFIGPHAVFTNDLRPRSMATWKIVETNVQRGASIGANATIRCGITLGEYSMIGAGAVVVKSVPPYALVYGNPAQMHGYVCICGSRLGGNPAELPQKCQECGRTLRI
ncbi:MAG TPA: acyltransferase [Candidatus Hodarchaeales archaeon]|nr:acyltransferase [Candidatus Hodarchaeales archaeon]